MRTTPKRNRENGAMTDAPQFVTTFLDGLEDEMSLTTKCGKNTESS